MIANVNNRKCFLKAKVLEKHFPYFPRAGGMQLHELQSTQS